MRTVGLAIAAFLALGVGSAPAATQPVNLLAAENFYGDVAEQVGGPNVKVSSILSNPDQDPHQFEVSPSTARAVSGARLVVYNGIDYDPWMDKLLAASPSSERKAIVAAALVGRKSGDNPHLWYDPATMVSVSEAVAAELTRLDPEHKADYDARLQAFIASVQPLQNKIAELRQKYQGAMVTATEPVFGYMAKAIGLNMRNQRFQMAVMNDTEPSASDVGEFENDLKNRQVRVLFYNNQTTDDLTKRLLDLAKSSHVPVVGVSETEPAGMNYQQWMMSQLNELEKALAQQ
ncbi:MAG TPA: metal ABC transporter solute-binding protein [Dongiaceae bacterium]|jgi:zinc/manganese transport system substrate-binding protein|nr:metal ABC transporter solute-binding protein [Dongiaceae bacterium]